VGSSPSSSASSSAELLERGWAHQTRASEELRAAVRDYEAAIAADPANAKAHYQFVAALQALGRPHDAIARYEGRDDIVSLRCLAAAYCAAGRWADAQAVIDRAPDDPSLLWQHGVVHEAAGRYEDALIVWERSLTDDAIDGRYSRAFLFDRLGRIDEAIAEWEAIAAFSPEDAAWPEQELKRLRG
jgi:tetratricopeptide (TPR) repeat protein